MSDRIEKLASNLVGTCNSLDEELTQEEAEELDSLVLECEICGWWYEADEMDEGECQSCKGDYDGN